MKMKTGRNFTLYLSLLLFILSLSVTATAQVTIGSGIAPTRATLLDLKAKQTAGTISSVTDDTNITSEEGHGGLNLPRVKLVNVKTLEPFIPANDPEFTGNTNSLKEKLAGLLIYNIHESPTSETDLNKTFKVGVYVWNGSKWNIVQEGGSDFFYLPSFNLPIAAIAAGLTYDLYNDVYKKQFTQLGNTTFVSSDASMAEIPGMYAASELAFVVTHYDDTVIKVNSISPLGVMNYDVLSTIASATSFINIVLVVK